MRTNLPYSDLRALYKVIEHRRRTKADGTGFVAVLEITDTPTGAHIQVWNCIYRRTGHLHVISSWATLEEALAAFDHRFATLAHPSWHTSLAGWTAGSEGTSLPWWLEEPVEAKA